jgi:hypothetical protein
MNDITSLNRISSLSAYLHDEFVSGGEIPPACYIEKLISECEPDFLRQLTNEEIFIAIRNATNSTCDSYIGNAHDSTNWTEQERSDEIARWEALRPERILEDQIAAIYKDADAAMNALRNSMTALLDLQDGLFDAGREETAKKVSLIIDSVVSAASRLESLANTDGNIYL